MMVQSKETVKQSWYSEARPCPERRVYMFSFSLMPALTLLTSASESGFDWASLALPVLWFGIIVLAVLVESATTDLVAIWFAPGAFISMILAFLDVSFTIQLSVCIGTAVLCLILTRTVFKKIFFKKVKIEKMNAGALPGKLALVEENINNASATGVAKINGQLWTARTEDPADLPQKGDWVEIVRVEGSKLICKTKK